MINLTELLILLEDMGVYRTGLSTQSRLRVEVGLDPLQMITLAGRLEHRGSIEFPPELLETLGTLDDVLYYYNVISGHSPS